MTGKICFRNSKVDISLRPRGILAPFRRRNKKGPDFSGPFSLPYKQRLVPGAGFSGIVQLTKLLRCDRSGQCGEIDFRIFLRRTFA